MSEEKNSNTHSWAPAITKGTFLLMTLLFSLAVIYILRNVLHAIILGVLFAMLLMPLNDRLLKLLNRWPGHKSIFFWRNITATTDELSRKKYENRNRSIASLCSIIIVILVVIVPLWLFGASIVHQGYAVTVSSQKWIINELPGKLKQFIDDYKLQEKLDSLDELSQKLKNGEFIGQKFDKVEVEHESEATSDDILGEVPKLKDDDDCKNSDITTADSSQKLAAPASEHPVVSPQEQTGKRSSTVDLSTHLARFVSDIMNFLRQLLMKVLSQVGTVIFNFCIMLFVMYQFFYDGKSICQYIRSISPLSEYAQQQVATRVRDVSKAVFLGIFGTAIIQGLCAILCFKCAGIPAFWGVVLGMCSIIPVVGTSIIWIPVVAYLCLIDQYGSAAFIFISCGCIIANFDMIIRPLLMKKSGETGMSYMVLFLSILGGVQTFGLVGVVYGPMITGICSICLLIFSTQFKESKQKKQLSGVQS